MIIIGRMMTRKKLNGGLIPFVGSKEPLCAAFRAITSLVQEDSLCHHFLGTFCFLLRTPVGRSSKFSIEAVSIN